MLPVLGGLRYYAFTSKAVSAINAENGMMKKPMQSTSETSGSSVVKPIYSTTPVIDNEATGKAIKKRRDLLSVLQGDLASRLGFSQGYMSDLERGKRNWTEELFEQAVQAIDQMANGRSSVKSPRTERSNGRR